ncbi:MAG: hypothetical protein GY757_34420 [bacterium]|nr:hypothetical protein [bacterium]
MKDLIEKTRNIAGPAPRSFTAEQKEYNHLVPPDWMDLEKEVRGLSALYKEREQLLTWGSIVWGCLVQANAILFKKGSDDCPGAVVFSMVPYYDEFVDDLNKVAKSLFSMKEVDPDALAPELKDFGRVITDEYESLFNAPVPTALSDERKTVMTSLMIHRKHLPNGILSLGRFPLLVMPGHLQSAMILPFQYWAPELFEEWCAGN